MPIYAYRCAHCGFDKDVLQKRQDPPLVDCPQCGQPQFARRLTAPAFQLKGTGWYVTDFRDGAKAKDGEKEAAKDGAAGQSKPGDAAGAGAGAAGGASGAANASEPASVKANGAGAASAQPASTGATSATRGDASASPGTAAKPAGSHKAA